MSTDRILFLGALAGLTIFLGLPIGRLRRPALRLKAFLSAAATGILLFLLWDVLGAASGPVEAALSAAAAQGGSWPYFIGLAALFAGGLTVGLLSLVYWDRWLAQRRAADMLGPGSASAAEFVRAPAFTPGRARQSSSRRGGPMRRTFCSSARSPPCRCIRSPCCAAGARAPASRLCSAGGATR